MTPTFRSKIRSEGHGDIEVEQRFFIPGRRLGPGRVARFLYPPFHTGALIVAGADQLSPLWPGSMPTTFPSRRRAEPGFVSALDGVATRWLPTATSACSGRISRAFRRSFSRQLPPPGRCPTGSSDRDPQGGSERQPEQCTAADRHVRARRRGKGSGSYVMHMRRMTLPRVSHGTRFPLRRRPHKSPARGSLRLFRVPSGRYHGSRRPSRKNPPVGPSSGSRHAQVTLRAPSSMGRPPPSMSVGTLSHVHGVPASAGSVCCRAGPAGRRVFGGAFESLTGQRAYVCPGTPGFDPSSI